MPAFLLRITDRNFSRAFEDYSAPFFTTKKWHGLGLSISASIIKRMGGELCFESYSGRGTKVSVLLPLGAKNDKK